MAVCSGEREYVRRFVEFANRRQASMLAVHGFTDSGELSAYTKEHPVDILLLSEELACDLPKKKEYGTVILLSGEEYQAVPQTEYPIIYKYQSCPQILRQAMDFYAEQAAAVPGVVLRREKMKCIGVYSPVGRTGPDRLCPGAGEGDCEEEADTVPESGGIFRVLRAVSCGGGLDIIGAIVLSEAGETGLRLETGGIDSLLGRAGLYSAASFPGRV